MHLNIKRNIRLVYLYVFFANTFFLFPVIIPFYQNQIGLGFKEFLMGEAIFSAVVIAMEVPSGWLSDVWSRRKTIIVGSLFAALGFFILMISNTLWMTFLAQGILGIAIACNSGTVTSIIYDSLSVEGKTHIYLRLEGKRHGISLYTIAFASVAGGLMYQYNPYLPLALDCFFMLFAALAAYFIVEPPRFKRQSDKNPINDMIVTIKYALHGHKDIAGIILVSTILFCSTKLMMWTQQPYMQLVGIDEKYFGYIIASGFLFGGFCGHFGHKLNLKYSNRKMLGLLMVASIFFGMMAAMLQMQWTILFILMLSAVWGFGFPFAQNAINKHADPARRATILSTLGLMTNLVFIPFSYILGWISDHFTITGGLIYLTIQLGIIGSLGLYIWSKGMRQEKSLLHE